MQRETRYQAAILENHCILLLRIEENGDSFWLIPGGGREGSESEEACVIREVQEETHLQVEIDRLMFHEKAPPHDSIYQQYRTYLCRIVGGVVRPGIEPEQGEVASPIKDIGWFDLRTVDAWDAHDASSSFSFTLLKRIREKLGYGGEAE